MKKIVLPLIIVSLSLSACTMPWSQKDDDKPKDTTKVSTTKVKNEVVHTLNYTLKEW